MHEENMHEHPHGHQNDSMGPFQGSPKTMFVLGLFVGIAVCMALALGFVVWSITSGKGLSLGGGTQQQQVAQAPTPTQPTPSANQPAAPSGPVKPVSASDHVRGAKNAKVTLIEYSDFECPFCKSIVPTIDQALKDYPNDVRVVYRHYPLSFHQNAEKEAEASECVAELGGNDAFWAFHDKIYERTTSNGTGFALADLGPLAKEIGVSQSAFQKCLDSGKYASAVATSEQEGADAGVQGTPATFINGKLVSGAVPYAQFKTMIDAALKK